MLIRLLLLVTLMSAAPAAEPAPGLTHLAGWMSGSFDSARQAAVDSAFFEIHLQMAPIWSGRADGPWLYVEQAVAGSLDKPYRQRVYHVTEPEPGLFVSEVYELPAPALRFAGAWINDSLLAGITPDSLATRQGCGVHLRWDEARRAYAGRTPGEGCLSSLRGATYATSEVSVAADGLESWDRGWDAQGLQVWGAVKSGYQFRRTTVATGTTLEIPVPVHH